MYPTMNETVTAAMLERERKIQHELLVREALDGVASGTEKQPGRAFGVRRLRIAFPFATPRRARAGAS